MLRILPKSRRQKMLKTQLRQQKSYECNQQARLLITNVLAQYCITVAGRGNESRKNYEFQHNKNLYLSRKPDLLKFNTTEKRGRCSIYVHNLHNS
jgi:hypothetical protein